MKPLFDKSNPSESSNSDLVESIDDLKNVIYNTFDYHLSRFEDNNKSLDELKSVLNKRLKQIRLMQLVIFHYVLKKIKY